tara:strand:- start:240 stop:1007 length:768 start_codon:yes stop_codon:yes gene_type:complete
MVKDLYMENTLTYAAFKKSSKASLKVTSYFEVYDHLFRDFKSKPITFVEIGILNGGSLFMWREFFGEKARIIGIDLNPKAKKWEKEGFEIFIGNQADPDFWDNFKSKVDSIDILLDDGGHTYSQQIVTTECLLDIMNDGGVLVVEDTHTSYADGYGKKEYSFIQYTKFWIDKINSRFSGFGKKQFDTRVWSVEIFESIVAFKINKKASEIISKPIWNKTPDEKEKDYRNFKSKDDENKKDKIKAIFKKAFSFYND